MLSSYITYRVCREVSKKKVPSFSYIEEWEKNGNDKGYASLGLKPNMDGYKNPWKILDTRYGKLKLYLHGDVNAKKTLIFVYGILSNNRTAIKLFDYFLNRGFKIISYDNFGWGESSEFGRSTFGLKETKLLRDIVLSIENKDNLYLYGESMGGGTVYSYVSKYGSSEFKKVIVDSGYNSFFKNTMFFAKKAVGPLAWLAIPGYFLQSLIFRLPARKFNHKKIDNMIHFHSINDQKVSYKVYMKKPIASEVYTFKDPNINHVRGMYEAKEEMYKELDRFLNS